MMYKLIPFAGRLIIEPLKPKDTKIYTSKVLSDIETAGLDVIQYGRVSNSLNDPDYSVGDIVLYQKLASHKTNFGDPRQVIVPIEYIEAKVVKDAD